MALAEIDVGALPNDVRSVVVDYRYDREAAYVRLGEVSQPVSRWNLPADTVVHVRARFRGARGRIGAGIEQRHDTRAQVEDRPHPADLAVPGPKAEQTDGPVIEIVQDVPDGTDPSEYEVEVVQAASGATTHKDGLHAGYAKPGEPLAIQAWPGGQKVYTRLVRLSDRRTSGFAGVEIPTVTATVGPTLDHSNGFGGGTIGKWGGSGNPASMEVSGGDLRHKAIYAGDAGGYAGDATDIHAGDATLYWPGRYTTANIALGFNESIMVGWEPDLTSITRGTRYAGSAWEPAGGPPRIQPDGTVFDPRPLRDNFSAGGGDEVPVQADVAIATSSTASPSFGASDFKPLLPGKVYADVNTYALRFDLKASYNKLVTIDNLNAWRWVWCRRRPWHTHSSGLELIYEDTLAANAVTTTASGIAGDQWGELVVQVLWTNNVAATVILWIRPNNDATAGNYVDSGGAETKFVMGPGIAQNEIQRAQLRIVRPASGSVREAIVDDAYSWTSAAVQAPAGGDSYIWKNTADQITSVAILTDNAGSALKAGSVIRIWGKRWHEA